MTSQPPETPPPPAEPAPASTEPAAPPAAPPVAPIFAPVPRAPRVPWVNPDRRSHVIGSALVAALVLLGAGFGIGYASNSDDHGRPGPARMERGGGFPPGLRMGRFPDRHFPGQPGRGHNPRPGATAGAPTPAPTSTK